MGNSQSNDAPKSPSATSTAHRETSRREREQRGDGSQHRNAGPQGGGSTNSSTTSARRAAAGAAAPSHATKVHSAPPPITASLLPSSTAQASTSTTTTHAQATVSATPASTSSHSRDRSITAAAPPSAPREDSASSRKSANMGNSESKQRPPSRSHTLPPLAKEQSEPSPVDVPYTPPQDGELANSPLYDGGVLSEGPTPSEFVMPIGDFSRPPRLPLPIDRDPEPASPLATPQDSGTPVDTPETAEFGHRPGSMLSSTTLDDDEVAEIETFTLDSDPYTQKVPTTLEWRGEGKAVYVTGTFAHWEKKFRMQKTHDADGHSVFKLTAPLPTGTHHIKFLVDGEMVLNDEYPTTVDYTASLVNYVEIAAPQPAQAVPAPAPAEPVPIPGGHASAATDHATRPLDIRSGKPPPEGSEDLSAMLKEDPVLPPPQESAPAATPQPQQHPEHLQPSQQPMPPKRKLPRPKYTTEIPLYLEHIDLYGNPDDERFKRATKATQHLPQPPSLPMFMSKSILNAATPHKDDASVLTMPNHTVLNHLATSSIRSGVLATSGTTRYKRKFLTTILYKPTHDN